jgi:hypothetical protein
MGVRTTGCPGFADILDETGRWNLIDFIHATTDAAHLTRSSAEGPIRSALAPNFAAKCPDGALVSLRDLFGRGVHLVFAGPNSAVRLRQLAAIEPVRRTGGVTTVVVGRNVPDETIEPFCTAITPEIAEAYAVFREADRSAAMDGSEIPDRRDRGAARPPAPR